MDYKTKAVADATSYGLEMYAEECPRSVYSIIEGIERAKKRDAEQRRIAARVCRPKLADVWPK
jgi:hypothetical protein